MKTVVSIMDGKQRTRFEVLCETLKDLPRMKNARSAHDLIQRTLVLIEDDMCPPGAQTITLPDFSALRKVQGKRKGQALYCHTFITRILLIAENGAYEIWRIPDSLKIITKSVPEDPSLVIRHGKKELSCVGDDGRNLWSAVGTK